MSSRYSRQQLAERAALSAADMVEVNRCRRDHNRLGFAYQLGFVRLTGRLPKQEPLELIDELVTYTGVQLGLDPGVIEGHQRRRETVAQHRERIRTYLNLRRLGPRESNALEAFVFEAASRLEHSTALQAKAKQFLKEQRISALQGIKMNPSKPSVAAMLSLVDKLAVIETTGVLEVGLSWLSSNYQRALFHYARKASADRMRELAPTRRRATLICFLWQSYRDAVDQSVDMFDKLLTRAHTQAQQDIDERLRRQRQAIQTSLAALKSLGRVLLDESIADGDLRAALFDQVPKRQLAAYIEETEQWVSGRSSHPFHGVTKRYGNLRKFAPAILQALQFVQDTGDSQGPCLRALQTLKDLNAKGRRKLPEGVQTSFVPRRLRPFVEVNGEIDRRAWECALLLRLRDEIRSGNVSVNHSKRFGRLDDFFIGTDQWAASRADFFRRASLPATAGDVPEYLSRRLGKAYGRFLESAPDNSYATVDDDGWRLSADPAADRLDDTGRERLQQLKAWLGRNMRRINLADLLIEVDNELGFTRHLMAPSQRQDPSPDDGCVTLAAVMAHGCNIGPNTMSQLTRDVSYKQLKPVSDWQLTDEAQRGALAELVGAIAALDTSLYWGEGRTSASDGQRFSLPRKVLQQTYSPKFSDFALEFYTFVADNYAPFHSTPIECTDRDAAFVLDGLLYNESELELEEHYTDTHGYTELNFAAFAILGRRFCPRIRGVQRQRIYRIDPDRDYGALASLVGRADRTIDTHLIAEQWDRMGQLYASFESGHATASVVLKRLAGYSASNRFYRANRDLGRILKTEFNLQYMSEPALRGRVRRGLLKVEQLHALARDVFYGRRGRINARELWGQMNSRSCLTLVVACIIYWQAGEIARVIREAEPEAGGLDLSLLEHVSPIEWDNVILCGQYILNRSHNRRRRS